MNNREKNLAYDEGFQARYASESKITNPYREGTELASAWNSGWRDADLDLGEPLDDSEDEDFDDEDEEE